MTLFGSGKSKPSWTGLQVGSWNLDIFPKLLPVLNKCDDERCHQQAWFKPVLAIILVMSSWQICLLSAISLWRLPVSSTSAVHMTPSTLYSSNMVEHLFYKELGKKIFLSQTHMNENMHTQQFYLFFNETGQKTPRLSWLKQSIEDTI